MDDASAALAVDARGIVTGWSEGARTLTGLSADEAVGRPVRDLLADEPTEARKPGSPGSRRSRRGRRPAPRSSPQESSPCVIATAAG